MGDALVLNQKMEIPSNIREAFSYAKTLDIAAKEDVEKGEYAYAMHKYKSMANKFIEAFKIALIENKELLSKAIKNTLDDMENINSKLKEQPKKQKTLGDINIGKKIREEHQ